MAIMDSTHSAGKYDFHSKMFAAERAASAASAAALAEDAAFEGSVCDSTETRC